MPRKPKAANPLFLKWVREFHREKDYRIRGGPPRATGYEGAINSLEYCTETYEHPKELKALRGIGPVCIEKLTEKLEEYCERQGIPMPEYTPPTRKGRGSTKPKAAPTKASSSKRKKQEESDEEEAQSTPEPAPKPKAVKAKAKGRASSGSKRKRVDAEEDDAFDEDENKEDAPPPAKTRKTTRKAKPVRSYAEENDGDD